jgi:hypothetical protein
VAAVNETAHRYVQGTAICRGTIDIVGSMIGNDSWGYREVVLPITNRARRIHAYEVKRTSWVESGRCEA